MARRGAEIVEEKLMIFNTAPSALQRANKKAPLFSEWGYTYKINLRLSSPDNYRNGGGFYPSSPILTLPFCLAITASAMLLGAGL